MKRISTDLFLACQHQAREGAGHQGEKAEWYKKETRWGNVTVRHWQRDRVVRGRGRSALQVEDIKGVNTRGGEGKRMTTKARCPVPLLQPNDAHARLRKSLHLHQGCCVWRRKQKRSRKMATFPGVTKWSRFPTMWSRFYDTKLTHDNHGYRSHFIHSTYTRRLFVFQ